MSDYTLFATSRRHPTASVDPAEKEMKTKNHPIRRCIPLWGESLPPSSNYSSFVCFVRPGPDPILWVGPRCWIRISLVVNRGLYNYHLWLTGRTVKTFNSFMINRPFAGSCLWPTDRKNERTNERLGLVAAKPSKRREQIRCSRMSIMNWRCTRHSPCSAVLSGETTTTLLYFSKTTIIFRSSEKNQEW